MDLIRNFLGGGSNGEEPDAKRVKREDDGSAGAANGGAIGTSTSGAGGAGGAGADGKVDHLASTPCGRFTCASRRRTASSCTW